MQVVNEFVYLKFFRPLGLGLGLVPLEAEATYVHEAEAEAVCSMPRPLKIGLEA